MMNTGTTFSSDANDAMRANTEALFSAWDIFNHIFARENPLQPELMQALKEGNVDVHARDANGVTLLHRATVSLQIDTIKHLLDHGADIHAKATSDDTPLHHACRDGSLETVKLLVERGADLEAMGLQHHRPLHNAAVNHSHSGSITRYLLEQGADPEARDYSGWTPLHRAASNPDAVQALLEGGANCEARAQNGATPLSLAWKTARNFNEQEELDQSLKLLLAYGANLNGLDHQNQNDFVIKSTTILDKHMGVAKQVLDGWLSGETDPAALTGERVMQMLSVWPLADLEAPVPRFEHLDAIFKDARWKDEHAEHKLGLIQEIPGLSGREQMFLMGGHARTLMQKQNTPTQAQGAER